MLENSIWVKYNKENELKECISKYCNIEFLDVIEDSKELYAALKSKLTKKELKLFSLVCSNKSDDEIKDDISFNNEELEQNRYKLLKKLKQNKIKEALIYKNEIV